MKGSDDVLAVLQQEYLPNWVSYLGNNITILQATWSAYCTLLIKSELSQLLIDLIIFGVSKSLKSPYCTEYHACNILRLHSSLNYQELVDIIEGNSPAELPEKYSGLNFKCNACIDLLQPKTL